MMRRRLRPAYTPEQLKQIYAKPHDHRKWHDHRLRVDVTIAFTRWVCDETVISAADLSCGNGAIIDALPDDIIKYKGDFAPGYDFTGPIEQTINQIPPVDLFICSETIEHLDDPDSVLRQIRGKARILVLSTPIGEDSNINPEHYWGWDQKAVGDMLRAAGWLTVISQINIHLPNFMYDYQLWGCR